jgi:predicted ATP-binding protein involved in virulence
MQRSLLPSLILAFPQVQFIIATHSPFMVSVVKDSSVYVLNSSNPNPGGLAGSKISSVKLDNLDKAGTAGDILRDALDVPVTLPDWTINEITAISNNFKLSELNKENIDALRKELDTAGLGSFYGDALKSIAENND